MAQIALIVPLGEMPTGNYPSQGLPGGGNYPSQGLPGQPGHPDQGLPGQPGHPSHPIAGQPGHPDQGLPVPPEVWPQPPFPPLPPDLESKIIVAVHKPGQPWTIKSYPVAPSQGLPPGQAQPKPAG